MFSLVIIRVTALKERLVGGNYFISVEQIEQCPNRCHIKLFLRLELNPTTTKTVEDCCLVSLTDSEYDLELVVNSLAKCSEMSKEEKSVTYYICGYTTTRNALL